MKKVQEEYLEKKYTQSAPSALIREYIELYRKDTRVFIERIKKFKIGPYDKWYSINNNCKEIIVTYTLYELIV